MFKKILTVLVVAIMVVANSSIVYASDLTNGTDEINWIEGPKTVDVGTDLAKLDLPEEYVFADGKDAKKLMKEMDNFITDKEQGIVFSKDEKENWYVLFEFDDIGYIKDSDSKNIDADALLSDIKKGTEEDNAERRKNGKSTIDIIGWDEKPHYDPNTHNLVWSVLSTSKGEKIVNYNVRILGRGGVTEVTLVAGKDEMDKVKPKLATIISKYSYKEGKRYSDYIKGDKAAEIGLTALIAGGAGAGAAKVGLLAKILLIFKKVWIVIIVAIGGLFKGIFKVFKRKPKNDNGINTNSEETGFKENPKIDEI
ncbi:DUF2167 domain-containing protein [Clostridium saccharoperbutylacetonicum]